MRLEYILSARGRSVPGMVWRALWPSREALAATDLRVMTMPRREMNQRRISRLRKGLANAPTIVDEALDYFREAARHRAEARVADESFHRKEEQDDHERR